VKERLRQFTGTYFGCSTDANGGTRGNNQPSGKPSPRPAPRGRWRGTDHHRQLLPRLQRRRAHADGGKPAPLGARKKKSGRCSAAGPTTTPRSVGPRQAPPRFHRTFRQRSESVRGVPLPHHTSKFLVMRGGRRERNRISFTAAARYTVRTAGAFQGASTPTSGDATTAGTGATSSLGHRAQHQRHPHSRGHGRPGQPSRRLSPPTPAA